MNPPRKVFLSVTFLLIVVTMIAITVLTLMEHQARAALPPEQQTNQAIAALYDGAVCLKCDLGRIFVAMLGFAAVVAALAGWAVYEIGRVLLVRLSNP